MSNMVIISAATLLLAGCSSSGSSDFRASVKYPICATLPDTLLSVPSIGNAQHFEYLDFTGSDLSGTIYVGDFPDYPRFSPDQKYYDPIGHIEFVGGTVHRGYYKELFRFGLGDDPAVHVLYLFKDGESLPAGRRPIGGLYRCGADGT